MDVILYNSLTRREEKFMPQKEVTTLYTCGPTVYNYPHIGNYRAYIFCDILKRILLLTGHQVNHTMNITDIDDKTIRDSQKEGKDLKTFTEFYTNEFLKDRDMLQILPPTQYTKATEYIHEMVLIIESLLEKDVAYKTEDGSIYFSIKKDTEYGKLTGIDPKTEILSKHSRLKADEYDKDEAQDFALWKAWDEADGDVFWETSLGKGRPGWHIECSAMSMSTLGETIDIHTGGIDNMFPHHENEIAQSECSTGKTFVRYWLHNAWLLVDGKKMAKSAGNFYTLRDIITKGYDPLAFRYLALVTHYRTPFNFTFEALEGASKALSKMHRFVQNIEKDDGKIDPKYKEQYLAKISKDLAIGEGLALAWELIHDNTLRDVDKKATLLYFDKVFGFGLDKPIKKYTLDKIPNNLQKLLEKRKVARKNKDWQKSDELRNEIRILGFEVTDTGEDQKLSKI